MRIIAIIGSNRKESTTMKFARLLLEKMKNKSPDIFFEIVKLADTNIEMCRGCLMCLNTGQCIYDKSDQMKEIKDMILTADIIILASPVYINNVTGIMKNFLDRMLGWMHIFRLVGKKGIILTTTDRSGYMYVGNYLEHVLWHLGLGMIGNYNLFSDELEDCDSQIEEYAEEILLKIRNRNYIYGTFMEDKFAVIKKEIKRLIDQNKSSFEVEYWKENLYNYSSWQELLEDANSINNY